jgi:hypothetical protein
METAGIGRVKARYTRGQVFGVVLAAVLTTAAVAWGGFALASGPTTNKYYACAKNGAISGAIKVNAKPTCPSGQKLVVWNQAGPKGATGATGPSNLAALQGTPCVDQGVAGTVSETIDETTGAVTLSCNSLVRINVHVSGGTLDSISIYRSGGSKGCANASTCSYQYAPVGGWEVDMSGASSYHVQCPGEGLKQDAGGSAACFYGTTLSPGIYQVNVTIP